MNRFLLCLPIFLVGVPVLVCLLLASSPREDRPASAAPVAAPVVKDAGAPLPDDAQMEALADSDPVAFLENCLRRYRREVHGYRAIMQKTERINGTLQPPEVIDVYFREKPHSVLLRWKRGARKAEAALYVEGANNGKMLARPNGLIARKLAGDVVTRDVAGSDARQSGRYPLDQFGIKKGTERTLAAWEAARAQGKLSVKHLPDQTLAQAGGRPCFVLRRTYAAPENDGVTELTIYIDKQNWLQVGSILKGGEGQLIGEYYFQILELNPTFPPGQFESGALSP